MPVVEAVARGLRPSDVHRFVSGVILPPLELDNHKRGRSVWPLRVDHASTLPSHVVAASAALGHEIRATGAVVQSRRQEEERAARKQVASPGTDSMRAGSQGFGVEPSLSLSIEGLLAAS